MLRRVVTKSLPECTERWSFSACKQAEDPGRSALQRRTIATSSTVTVSVSMGLAMSGPRWSLGETKHACDFAVEAGRSLMPGLEGIVVTSAFDRDAVLRADDFVL